MPKQQNNTDDYTSKTPQTRSTVARNSQAQNDSIIPTVNSNQQQNIFNIAH